MAFIPNLVFSTDYPCIYLWNLLWDDSDDSEAEEDTGPADEDEKPEPEEHVDLLVNNV